MSVYPWDTDQYKGLHNTEICYIEYARHVFIDIILYTLICIYLQDSRKKIISCQIFETFFLINYFNIDISNDISNDL